MLLICKILINENTSVFPWFFRVDERSEDFWIGLDDFFICILFQKKNLEKKMIIFLIVFCFRKKLREENAYMYKFLGISANLVLFLLKAR